MRPGNYLTQSELSYVQNLVAALNDRKPPAAPLAADVVLCDSNGDDAGSIEYNHDALGYVYYGPREDPAVSPKSNAGQVIAP